jgi:hypothetical protein
LFSTYTVTTTPAIVLPFSMAKSSISPRLSFLCARFDLGCKSDENRYGVIVEAFVKDRLLAIWEDLRANFWFVAALMALAAAGLATGTVALDACSP